VFTDNLGEIPCSSALPPTTTTTSINWDTTVTAPLQATATSCNDVEECFAACSENANGQKFTAVNPLDDTTWAGIFACDDESVPPATTASS
jgi:hypothetical protein